MIRRWLLDLPIRRKLVVVMTITSTIALLLASAALLAWDALRFKEELREDLQTLAELVGDSANLAVEFDDPPTARELLATLDAQEHLVSAALYNDEGAVLATYTDRGVVDGTYLGDPVPPPPERPGPDGAVSETSAMVFFGPVRYEGRRVGTIYLRTSLAGLYERMRTRAVSVAAVLLAAWLVTLLLSSSLQRLVSDPILELAAVARDVSARQDYSARATAHGSDELGLLVSAFNDMLSQIERRDADLLASKQMLEERVAERTAQLAAELRTRQAAEQQLAHRNAELEQRNQDLDDFAYVASHDLKEPLRGIHNYAAFLLQDYGDRLDADGRAKLETLNRLSRRMETLIDSLLHYSRLGRSGITLERVDVGDLVREVLDTHAFALRERAVEVRVGALPVVETDRVRLGEVFANLVTNAMKYNDKPRRWIEIGALPHDPGREAPGHVTFYVRDNGIGIPERHHETVFRIFKRLHARDQFGGGTGAGLTIVRKIVERQRGRVWIESAAGQGTTVYFTLPATRAAHA